MCVVYVDDLIFWCCDVANIDRVVMELRKLGVALEQEDDAAGLLGVKMECDSNTGLFEMKQTGLIERVIEVEALGLDDGYAWGKHTLAETKPLVKDEDGVAAAEGFSHSSVVGILLALKCIGRYLNNTSSCGMVINPTRELTIDAYPDADFAGMYGHEKLLIMRVLRVVPDL